MTFAELLEDKAKNEPLHRRIGLRWLARRCRRDPDFAACIEEEVAVKLGTHQANIDWSKVDWAKVLEIVLLILKAFSVV
jgi:hypothetical protein